MSNRIYSNKDIQEQVALAASKLPDAELSKLCNKDYSKSVFDINFPLFVKIPDYFTDEQRFNAVKDEGDINRWTWKFEFKRNGYSYAITTQWFARNDKYVQRWLSKYQ
jgi:hypothetical protein